GGSLFLATVRPGAEDLWLVAVLEAPKKSDAGWSATKNAVPITDISSLRSKIRFATGTGMTNKPGAPAMSLQTPRTLADDDGKLLRPAAGVSGTATAQAGQTTATAAKSPRAVTASPTPACEPTREPEAAPPVKPAKAAETAKAAPLETIVFSAEAREYL